mmetsp:Transcript_9446/g.27254  ORF Transcript_9446/g.27254 Transcript_9446/m.27254 type:complete len:210 (+) Transcript_9446:884-1513(+)
MRAFKPNASNANTSPIETNRPSKCVCAVFSISLASTVAQATLSPSLLSLSKGRTSMMMSCKISIFSGPGETKGRKECTTSSPTCALILKSFTIATSFSLSAISKFAARTPFRTTSLCFSNVKKQNVFIVGVVFSDTAESDANAPVGSKQSYVILVKPSFSSATTFNDTASSFSFSIFLFTYSPSCETSGVAALPEREFAPRETLKLTMS